MVLQYHYNDTYATSATEAKSVEYGVRGFPTMFFNGGNLLIGGSNASYNKQTTVIEEELAKTPPVAIVATLNLSGGITVAATLTNTSNTAISNVELFVVLYEDLGTDEHYYTARDILVPLTIASLAPGATQQFTLNSNYTGGTANIHAVVYLKASNGEILQAALASG